MALRCEGLAKHFGKGPSKQTVLDQVSLEFRAGERCALLGPSGSGKTTLISILGCLVSPTSGTVEIAGANVDYRSKGKLSSLRREKIGFVFQSAQLLPFLTVYDNLYLAGRNAGVGAKELSLRIGQLLERLGVSHLRQKSPNSLSGGERQRIAVARAVVHRPPILLADEPTASLDWQNGRKVVELLVDSARINNSLLITVTHDPRVAEHFDRHLTMDSGKVHQ
jgi:putative ABC transport system ATP-binding protein